MIKISIRTTYHNYDFVINIMTEYHHPCRLPQDQGEAEAVSNRQRTPHPREGRPY